MAESAAFEPARKSSDHIAAASRASEPPVSAQTSRPRAAGGLRPSQVPVPAEMTSRTESPFPAGGRAHPGLQRLRPSGAPAGAALARPSAVPVRPVQDVLRSPGQPLAAPVREEMQARLGADLSGVRVHTGAAARASAAEVGARAWTAGNDVVIGDGTADKHVFAHELTHVIQQRQGPVAGTDHGRGFKVSDPFDVFEQAAEANAARVMRAPPSQHRLAPAGTGGQRTPAVHPAGGSEQTHEPGLNPAGATSDTGRSRRLGLVHVLQEPGVCHGDAGGDTRGAQVAATAVSAAPLAAPTGRTSVQRLIENATYNTDDADMEDAAHAFFTAVDQATQAAYQYVVSVPSLGAYAGLDGRTQHWAKLWAQFVAGGRPKLMAAAFGYAVESLVSDPRSKFTVTIPSGYSVLAQYVSGGTRPDLVLRLAKGTKAIAWLDLTASGSVGHIYDKENWEAKVDIFAEVTYPSLGPGTLALMWQNKNKTGTVSAAEFEEQMAAAEAAHLERQKQWHKIGKGLQLSKLTSEVVTKTRVPKNQWDLGDDPGKVPRKFIAEKLKETFSSEQVPDEKMVPSILRALGVNPTSWGYTIGFSESLTAGEAWLVDNPLEEMDTT
jgi:hypothetical protein